MDIRKSTVLRIVAGCTDAICSYISRDVHIKLWRKVSEGSTVVPPSCLVRFIP